MKRWAILIALLFATFAVAPRVWSWGISQVLTLSDDSGDDSAGQLFVQIAGGTGITTNFDGTGSILTITASGGGLWTDQTTWIEPADTSDEVRFVSMQDINGPGTDFGISDTGVATFQSVSDADGPGTNWSISTGGAATFASDVTATGAAVGTPAFNLASFPTTGIYDAGSGVFGVAYLGAPAAVLSTSASSFYSDVLLIDKTSVATGNIYWNTSDPGSNYDGQISCSTTASNNTNLNFYVNAGADSLTKIMDIYTTGGASTVRMGTPGTNDVRITQAGVMSFYGSGDINLPAGAVDATTELDGALCGTNEILEDQGASWACIATPTGGGLWTDQTTWIEPADTSDEVRFVSMQDINGPGTDFGITTTGVATFQSLYDADGPGTNWYVTAAGTAYFQSLYDVVGPGTNWYVSTAGTGGFQSLYDVDGPGTNWSIITTGDATFTSLTTTGATGVMIDGGISSPILDYMSTDAGTQPEGRIYVNCPTTNDCDMYFQVNSGADALTTLIKIDTPDTGVSVVHLGNPGTADFYVTEAGIAGFTGSLIVGPAVPFLNSSEQFVTDNTKFWYDDVNDALILVGTAGAYYSGGTSDASDMYFQATTHSSATTAEFRFGGNYGTLTTAGFSMFRFIADSIEWELKTAGTGAWAMHALQGYTTLDSSSSLCCDGMTIFGYVFGTYLFEGTDWADYKVTAAGDVEAPSAIGFSFSIQYDAGTYDITVDSVIGASLVPIFSADFAVGQRTIVDQLIGVYDAHDDSSINFYGRVSNRTGYKFDTTLGFTQQGNGAGTYIIGFDFVDQTSVTASTNLISIRNQDADAAMWHAGPAKFGAASAPNAKAMVELTSTTKMLKLTQMTYAQMAAVGCTNADYGIITYCTNCTSTCAVGGGNGRYCGCTGQTGGATWKPLD